MYRPVSPLLKQVCHSSVAQKDWKEKEIIRGDQAFFTELLIPHSIELWKENKNVPWRRNILLLATGVLTLRNE